MSIFRILAFIESMRDHLCSDSSDKIVILVFEELEKGLHSDILTGSFLRLLKTVTSIEVTNPWFRNNALCHVSVFLTSFRIAHQILKY